MTEEILSLANALNDSIKVIKNDLDFTLAVIKDLDENNYPKDNIIGQIGQGLGFRRFMIENTPENREALKQLVTFKANELKRLLADKEK